jgi:putative transposase
MQVRVVLQDEVAGIDVRTLRRWKSQGGLAKGDGRPDAPRPRPAHALTPEERSAVLQVANEPRFADMPPARIVPMLADEGTYLASESTFSRILTRAGQSAHRGRAKSPQAKRAPQTHVASAPGQVWCWDMTYLPTQVGAALPVSYPGPVQPQNHRLGSACQGRWGRKRASNYALAPVAEV